MSIPNPITSKTLTPGFVNKDSFYNAIWTVINALISWGNALVPTPPVFTAASLASGFVPYPGFMVPGYYKDAAGCVYLHGLIENTSGATKAAGTTLFTLPVGYRPAGHDARFATATSAGDNTNLNVSAAGVVSLPYDVVTNTGFVFLDKVFFYTGV